MTTTDIELYRPPSGGTPVRPVNPWSVPKVTAVAVAFVTTVGGISGAALADPARLDMSAYAAGTAWALVLVMSGLQTRHERKRGGN